jgi:hypothetical protein
MSLVGVVFDLESITTRIQILVSNYLVTQDVDVSFDLLFLIMYINIQRKNLQNIKDLPFCYHSLSYTYELP